MTGLALPLWPDATSPEGKTFFANAEALYAGWRALGYANPFAIGFGVTQPEAETSLDPNAKGDYLDARGNRLPWSAHPTGTPSSFGLFQRKKVRCDAIKAETGVDIYADVMADKNTIENEIKATEWELHKFPSLGLNVIQAQHSASMAAYQACVLFERAGAAGAAEMRGRMATRWTAHFAKKEI
jgi:hypothetical protein